METRSLSENSFDPRRFKVECTKKILSQMDLSVNGLSGPWQSFYLYFHGVPCRFDFDSTAHRESFEKNIPEEWRSSQQELGDEYLRVRWMDASPLNTPHEEGWDWDPNPDFETKTAHGVSFVVQRDFVGWALGERDWIAITSPRFGDGFYNMFRYFFPLELIRHNTLVLHSSCVVDNAGDAHVFLGHSGAGKSTLASLSQEMIVLGDDINLLHISEDGLFAESALLGGNPKYKGPLGALYPVRAFYWLNRHQPTSLKKLSRSQLAGYLAVSCFVQPALFEQQRLNQKVLELVRQSILWAPGYELGFELNQDFWKLIKTEVGE